MRRIIMALNNIQSGQGLIKTQYTKPGISHNLISRPRITKKLDQALQHKLTFVTAPAGYGKSTAVLEWIEKRGLPSAWISLDESQNDPVRFWRYIMAAIGAGGFVRHGGSFTDIPLNGELIFSNLFIDLLMEKLYDITENLVIVLDDYHLIQDELVQKSMEHFLKTAPTNINIILLSREELPPALEFLFAKDQVLQLGSRELSFNFDEITDFFIKRGFQLTSEDISCLEASTEGWVSGLVIAAFTMEEGFDVRVAAKSFSGSNRHIGSFIGSEVFERWPQEVKEFLVHTSFLDKLSQPLCDKVTGTGRSDELLKMLSKSNSFIIPLDHEDHWFRYHHLFREFLMGKLDRESSNLQRILYDNAGQWYLENGYIQDAINCFIKAQEFLKAFPLVWDIYLSMTQNGEYSTWRKWMASMPEALCESDVQACTGYSWVLSMENRLEEARVWVDKAQACYDRIKDSIDLSKRKFLEANIELTYANAAIFALDSSDAVRRFKKIQEFDIYTPVVIGEMNPGEPNFLNTVYGFRGRLNKVEETYGGILGELPRFLGDFSAYFAVALAECRYEKGSLKEVNAALVKNIGRITGLNNSGLIVPCFITLAKEKMAKGDVKGAFQIIESGRTILNGKNKELWNYFFDVFTANLFIRTGDVSNAAKWLAPDRIGIFDPLSYSREFESIVFARYLMLTNRLDEALLLLNRLEGFAQKEDRLRSRVEILCLTAIGYHLQGNANDSMSALHKALGLGAENGYVRIFVDEAQPMAELLGKYKTWGRKTGYIQYADYAKNLLKLTRAHIKVLNDIFGQDAEYTSIGVMAEMPLSVRESEVLKLLIAEYSNQEIADELFITVRTVKHHNAQIYEKMKVKNRLEAIIRAREWKLAEY